MTTIADIPLPGRASRATEPKDIRAKLPLAAVCAELGILPDASSRALCPFHDDHTPSFHLWHGQSGERWGCWPCGLNGDHFELIQRVLGLSFPQAKQWATELLERLPKDYSPPAFSFVRSGGSGSKGWTEEQRQHWERELRVGDLWAGWRSGALPLLLGFVDLDRDSEAVLTGWNAHLRAWGLGFCTQYGFPAAYIPHRSPEGLLTGIKTRRKILARSDTELRRRGCLERKGEIVKGSIEGSKFESLWGCWRGRTHGIVLLTEGEPDALWASKQIATQALPIDVYSLPGGAGSNVDRRWFDFLRGADVVWTAFDYDEAGEKLTERFADGAARAGADCRTFDFSPDFTGDLREAAPDLSVLVRERR